MVEPASRSRRPAKYREIGEIPPPRPVDFVPLDRIVGLDAARSVLTGALRRNALAGTYLLKGPTGVGKTTLARAFAQAATCTSPADDGGIACGSCMSCTLVARGTHPEVLLISPSGDQTQIWQFWDRPGKPPGALERTLPFSPSVGARRVYIIERADTLNAAASNSLLKVLEEPPAYALFLLLTPNAERLLPTVVSRSQVVTLSPLPVDELEQWLVEAEGLEPHRARLIATLSEGRVGTARQLTSDAGVYEHVEAAMKLTLQLLQATPLRALKLSEQMRQIGAQLDKTTQSGDEASSPADSESGGRPRVERRGLGMVLDLMAFTLRDVLALGAGSERAYALSPECLSAARSHPETALPDRCMHAIDVLLRARRRLDQNVPPNLLTDWITTSIVVGQNRAHT